MWGWLSLGSRRRRRSPFNNLGPDGLTCGQVTEHLFVGGELGPQDWPALRQVGITMVINLQLEQQDIFSEEEQVDGYLWLPAPDGLAPSLGQLALGVDFIQSAVEGNRKVLVHCKAGQGRAPLLCACYLISQGVPLMDALVQVRQARSQTMLTPEQNVRLREFAAAFATKVAALEDAAEAQSQDVTPTQAEVQTTDTPSEVASEVAPAVNASSVASITPNSTPNGITNGTSAETPHTPPVTTPAPKAKHSPA